MSADAMVGDEEDALQVPIEYLNTDGARLPAAPPGPQDRHVGYAPPQPEPGGGALQRLPAPHPAFLLSGRLLEVTIATGPQQRREVSIPRIALLPPEDAVPFSWERRQFPVKPALGMTIHKAQGQTLGRVAVLLTEPAFTHGQLYVAASRVGIADQLHFALPAGHGGNMANWPTWSTAPPCTATTNHRRPTHRTGPKCFLLAGFGELCTTRGVSSLQKEIHPQSSVAASIYYTSVKL